MRKSIKYSIVVFLALAVVVYIYFTKYTYWKMDEKARDEIVCAIQSAESLPDKFYELYNKIYPNSLNKGQLYYLLNRDKENSECPCRLAGYNISASNDIHLVNITFWLEDQVSQKECLNYYSTNVDLLYNIKGVKQASEYYFNKSINDMSDHELIELIVMMENPFFYSKKRSLGKLKNRVNNILNRINT